MKEKLDPQEGSDLEVKGQKQRKRRLNQKKKLAYNKKRKGVGEGGIFSSQIAL